MADFIEVTDFGAKYSVKLSNIKAVTHENMLTDGCLYVHFIEMKHVPTYFKVCESDNPKAYDAVIKYVKSQ